MNIFQFIDDDFKSAVYRALSLRKDIDKLTDLVKVYKAKALSYLKYNDKELTGSIVKMLSDDEKKKLVKEL